MLLYCKLKAENNELPRKTAKLLYTYNAHTTLSLLKMYRTTVLH